MESLTTIVQYIDNMKIKSTLFGGFDRESVYGVIQDISSMYQKNISELQRENAKLKNEFDQIKNDVPADSVDQRQYELSIFATEAAKKEAAALRAELEEANSNLKAARNEADRLERSLAEAEKRASQAEETVKELQKKNEENSKDYSAIKDKFATLDAAINAVKQSEERAYTDARLKADSIIDDARLEASRIAENGTKECQRITGEIENLKNLKNEIERSLADISSSIRDLYFRTDVLRKKYITDTDIYSAEGFPAFSFTHHDGDGAV